MIMMTMASLAIETYDIDYSLKVAMNLIINLYFLLDLLLNALYFGLFEKKVLLVRNALHAIEIFIFFGVFLELLLENNYVNYSVLNQKIEITTQQEKIANNNLTLAIKQYKEGLINISERLEAENDSYKAAVNKINTLIEQRLAAIETIMATGELTQHISKSN